MKTIVAVYTGQGLDLIIRPLFQEIMPEHRLINIIDDGLIHQVMTAGAVTQDIYQRLFHHYAAAELAGADVILNTCSSVGRVADAALPFFATPIVRIDRPMARAAISSHHRIGVIATIRNTLEPTLELLQLEADNAAREIILTEGLAQGAYLELVAGNRERHDSLIREQALELSRSCDAIILAQGSMACMQSDLESLLSIPVYSSPKLALQHILNYFVNN
ncbi:MAG TPA: Asp/Glu/hydantoin racemase [Clostridiales bacterium]|nr:Asp/Glu/hydantoin racemase [Clostridiales bacterium]